MINIKKCLFNSKLSFKAKGIYMYLVNIGDKLSEFKVSDLANKSKDSQCSIASGIKELKDNGYLSLEVFRNNGKFEGVRYHLYESAAKNPDFQ